MFQQDEDSLLPVYPLPRMQRGADRLRAHMDTYQAMYARRLDQGVHYASIPLDMGVHFGRHVVLELVPGRIDEVKWWSGPADPDPENPPVLFEATQFTGGFFCCVSDALDLDNWQEEFPDEYVRATTFFVVWAWMQFRIAEAVFDCFQYRPRVGAGNFNNH